MLAQIIEAMGYIQVHNSILLINVMIRRAVEFEQKASSSITSISRRCKQDQINLQRFFAVGNVGGD